jgi:hypothetical protein
MRRWRWVGGGGALALAGLVLASAACGSSSATQPAPDAGSAGDARRADARTPIDASKGTDATPPGEGGGGKGLMCTNPDAAVLTGSLRTSQLGGGCDSSLGGATAGKPCKSSSDCKPACCACPSDAGGKSVSVGYCKQGACATAEDTCCTFALQEMLAGGGGLCP